MFSSSFNSLISNHSTELMFSIEQFSYESKETLIFFQDVQGKPGKADGEKYCLYIKNMRSFSCSMIDLLMSNQHRACSNGLDLFKDEFSRIIGVLLFVNGLSKQNRSKREINFYASNSPASTISLIKDFQSI